MLQGVRLFSEQRRQQRLSRDVQVLSYVSEDSIQCADPERLVTGNRDTVLASLSGSQAHVAAGLPCYFVAIAPKQDGRFLTTQFPR